MEDVEPSPLTGDAGVDAVTSALAAQVTGPLPAHVPAYEQAHRALQDRLADGQE